MSFTHVAVRHPLGVAILVAGLAGCGGADTTNPVPVPPDVPVASVTVSGAPTTPFLVGDSVTLIASPRSASGAALTNRVITWSSSAAAIASVSASGQVRALREGRVTITASTAGQSATAAFDVAFGRLVDASGGAIRNADSSFFLNVASGILTQPTLVFVRAVDDSVGDARVVPGSIFAIGNDSTTVLGIASLKLRFSSARVPSTLALESLQLHVRTAAGWVPQFNTTLDLDTRIVDATVFRGGVYAIRSVPVDRIAITGISAGGGVYAGGTGALGVELFDAAGARVPDRKVSWTSSAPAVVSVDSIGHLRGGTPGVATITVVADGKSATTTVTCVSNVQSDLSRAAEWSTFQGSFGHSGYVAATIDPTRLREKWVVPATPDVEFTQVTVGGGRVFVATKNLYADQQVVAFSATDGSRVWSKAFEGVNTLNQPTFANGSLYVTSNGVNAAYLTKLRESDGTVQYQVPFDGFESTSNAPVIVGGTVVTPGGLQGGLYGFDAATGLQRFFREGSSIGVSTPSLADGRLHTTDRGLQAIDPADGSVVSQLTDVRLAVTTLAVNPNQLGAGISDGRLFIARLPGQSLQYVGDRFQGMPVVRSDIFAFSADRVEQIGADGVTKFSFPLNPLCGSETRSMLLTDNLLFVSCVFTDGEEGLTVAFDVNTRYAVWTFPSGGTMSLSSQGVLYIVKRSRVTAIGVQ